VGGRAIAAIRGGDAEREILQSGQYQNAGRGVASDLGSFKSTSQRTCKGQWEYGTGQGALGGAGRMVDLGTIKREVSKHFEKDMNSHTRGVSDGGRKKG